MLENLDLVLLVMDETVDGGYASLMLCPCPSPREHAHHRWVIMLSTACALQAAAARSLTGIEKQLVRIMLTGASCRHVYVLQPQRLAERAQRNPS